MKLHHHKPAARGVNQLMYVGDDQAVESATATGALSTPVKVAIAVVVGWLLFGGK
jgi:hypothetical protein